VQKNGGGAGPHLAEKPLLPPSVVYKMSCDFFSRPLLNQQVGLLMCCVHEVAQDVCLVASNVMDITAKTCVAVVLRVCS
jgi:hypothetical protein